MIKNLRHVGIVTKDIESSILFYETLGFKKTWDKDETGAFINFILGDDIPGIRTVKMKTGSIGIELLCFKKNKNIHKEISLTDNIITHFAVEVEDINKIYEDHKVNFINAPHISPDGKVIVAFMKDPNNNLFLELVEVI